MALEKKYPTSINLCMKIRFLYKINYCVLFDMNFFFFFFYRPHIHVLNNETIESADVTLYLNPVVHFLTFGKGISWDGSVLLDFIISNETNFLEYFVKILKIIAENKSQLEQVCQQLNSISNCKVLSTEVRVTKTPFPIVCYSSSDEEDGCQYNTAPRHTTDRPAKTDVKPKPAAENFFSSLTSMIHNVRLSIEKSIAANLLPFNGWPLVRLLKTVENINMS